MTKIPLIALLAACAGPAPQTTAVARTSLTAASVECVEPDGLPGDGLSDRLAIQAAIDQVAAQPDGGTVCLGPGRWTLDRAPLGSYNRFAALHCGAKPSIGGAPATTCHHVTIRGAGPETVLELPGDQGNATTLVIDVMPGAEYLTVSDLTIDTTAATNTEEQTHAIATSGFCAGAQCLPIRALTVEHVTFRHPRVDPAHRKGDCIRLLGNGDATRLYGVRIAGNHFIDCARSAVTIQRGVHDLVVTGNPRIRALKTCIDGEATGGPTDTDARATVTGNTFEQCPTAISLTSYQDAVIAANNVVGGITVYRSTSVAITGNTIRHVAVDGTGTIDVANACDGLVVSGNTVMRSGAPGAAVKITPHSGVTCQRLRVAGNVVTLANASFGIYTESVSHAAITDNTIVHAVAAPSIASIYARAVIAAAPVTGLLIAGNQISGPATYAIQLSASPATFGAGVLVHGNAAVGTTFGLVLSNTGGYTAPLTVYGNALGPPSYGSVPIVTGD